MAKEKLVAQAIRSAKSSDSLVTLSNGIVLRAKRVPNLIFMEVTGKFVAPKVPHVMNADIGREEDNPNDPGYIAEYNKFQADLSLAIIDTMVVMGTELVSVPQGVMRPEQAGWDRRLKAIHIDVPSQSEDDLSRYMMWVKYYACGDEEDLGEVVKQVGRLSGVSQEDVDDALDQFRSVS